jgi:hypothetical protein
VSKTETRRLQSSIRKIKTEAENLQESLENCYELEEEKKQRFQVVWDPSSAPEKGFAWVVQTIGKVLKRIRNWFS